jgi:ribosomal protein S18 acetylase RimI-like enzyme
MSPTQRAQTAAAAQGAVKVAGKPKNENDARQHAATMATQRMLNAHGAHLKVDGVWGPATDSAYQAYLHHASTFRAKTAHLDASANPLSAPLTKSLIPTKAEIAATGRAMPFKQDKPFFDGQKPATYEYVGYQLVPVYHNPWHGPGEDWLTKQAKAVVETPYVLGKAVTGAIVQPAVDAVQGVLPQWMKGDQNPDTQPPDLRRAAGALPGGGGTGAGADYQPGPNIVQVGTAIAKGFAHPVTDLFGVVTGTKKATTSGVLSDLANIALMASPAKLAEVGGSVRAALAAGKTADEVIPQVAEMYKAIDQAPGMTAAQKAASKQQVESFINALATYKGEDPKAFVSNVLKGAEFKDIAPTTADFATHAGAVEHIPTETLPQAAGHRETFKAPADAIFKDTVANAGKTKIENILPPGIDSPEKLAGLMKELQLRAIEASDYRHWYENSGRRILAHTGGDTTEATKLAALVAAYSPQAAVYHKATEWNNLDRALRAYNQFKETGTVPRDVQLGDWQTRAAQKTMEGQIDWNGLKTNRFFRNFLEHIDPETYKAHYGDEQFSTQDLWMARAFKYPKDDIGGGNAAGEMTGQYKFMHDVTKAVGDSLGWSPSETQAAIWTSMKAEREGTDLATAGADFSHGLEHTLAREQVKRYFGVKASHSKGEYMNVLQRVSEALGRKLPASGKLGQGARVEAEQALRMWARQSDDPAALAWRAVTDEVKQAHAMKSLQQYFADGNPLLDKIASAQGREVLAQGGEDVKGAATRFEQGHEGTHITLFRKADASTVVHEMAHAAEAHMPPELRKAIGGDAETFARTLEEYFRGHESVIGNAIHDIYKGEVPGSRLSPEAEAHLDAFFRGGGAEEHAFISQVADFLRSKEAPYSIHAEHDASPSAKTLWHNGQEMDIAGANKAVGAGDLLHFHAYDEHGNLVGALHGADHGDRVNLTSVKVLPEHEGRGIGTALIDKLREHAGDRPLAATFQNEALGAREVARSEALGRPTGFDQSRWETLFQKGKDEGHDLIGLPKGRSANAEAQDIAARYMEKTGRKYEPPTKYAKVDPERARRIAEWYDAAVSAPNDPKVRAAYDAMAKETLDQYNEIVANGYTFEFYPEHDPYPVGPQQAMDDLRENKHMYVFPTEGGFGSINEAEATHPLLADSGVKWGGKKVTHNDIFRAVHDYFGHFKEGVGFRAGGEENAWRSHSAMYSDEARGAMTAETRGQNSWVNYGPHGEANKTASQADTVYADQKAVIAPDWVVNEGARDKGRVADFMNWDGMGAARDELSAGLKALPKDMQATFREYGMKPEDLRAKYYPEENATETLFQQAAEHDGPSHWQGSAHALADMHGVDIAKVPPTGEGGRVTVGDVERYIFQHMPPADQLKSLLQGLSVQRGKQGAMYSAERSQRFGEVRGIMQNENLSNEEARAAIGDALKGELPKIIVNGHARDMTQATLDELVSTVRYHPTLQEGQKVRVWDALNDLVHNGRVPQKSELALMRHVWGRGTTMSLVEELTKWQKLGRNLGDIINVPRSVMSSMDVSFGLRQALVAAAYDPATWFRAWKGQFKLLGKWTEGLGAEQGGEAAYKALMEHIYDSPNFPLYQEMGLAITDMEHALGLREEGFQSNLAERLTGGEHSPIRGSGRAYTGMAIKLRTELADRLLADAAAAGQDVHDEEFLKELGHFINGITGRGKFPHKVLEEGSPLLSALFFSPRLMASRLQMLNPYHYIFGNAFVRRQYLKAGLRFYGTLATVLAAIKYFVPGASVTFNPRSSDFGKVKLRNNRIDMGGGFNQFIHLFGMIATGQKQNTTTGQITPLGSGKFGQETRADAFIKFMEGKLSPSSSIVKDWASDSDPKHLGQGFNSWDEFTSHMTPLIAQDAWQVYNDPNGTGLNGITAAVAGYGLESTGVGLQNYGPSQPGAKTLKKLSDEAKAEGFKIPPQVEQQMKNLAALKSITTSYQGDPSGAAKAAVALYAKTTGKHNLDKYAGTKDPAIQKQLMRVIRAQIAGEAQRYETIITRVAKAKGIK